MGMRSYFAKMRRDAEREKSLSGRVSSVDRPSDPAYADWVVTILKALQEISAYEAKQGTWPEKTGDVASAFASNSNKQNKTTNNNKSTDNGNKSTDNGNKSTDNGNKNVDNGNINVDNGNKNTDNGNKNTDHNNSKCHNKRGHVGGGGGQASAGDTEADRVYVGHSKTFGLFTSERMRERIEEHGEMPPDFTYFREVQPIELTEDDPAAPPPEPRGRVDNNDGSGDHDEYGDGDYDEYGDGDDGAESDVLLVGDGVSANPAKALACARSSKRWKDGDRESGTRRASYRPERSSLPPSEGEALRALVVTRAREEKEKSQADEEARLRREAEGRKERELREDRRLVEEHKRWEQDRKDRIEREALEREEAQKDREERAAKDAADREERRHERELKADVEKARLAAEEKRQTQQHEMMMKVMEVMMKSSKE